MNNFVLMDNVDPFDVKILKLLSQNSEIPLRKIAEETGIRSPSAISRRIQRLRDSGIITKNAAKISFEKLGFGFITLTFVRAKYSPNYKDSVAEKIRNINGVLSIYFLLGDIDFVVVTISKSKEGYEWILEQLINIPEIERTDSRTVLKVYSEDEQASILEGYDIE